MENDPGRVLLSIDAHDRGVEGRVEVAVFGRRRRELSLRGLVRRVRQPGADLEGLAPEDLAEHLVLGSGPRDPHVGARQQDRPARHHVERDVPAAAVVRQRVPDGGLVVSEGLQGGANLPGRARQQGSHPLLREPCPIRHARDARRRQDVVAELPSDSSDFRADFPLLTRSPRGAGEHEDHDRRVTEDAWNPSCCAHGT